jgi:uncharacterized membrane protein (DUF485 family)
MMLAVVGAGLVALAALARNFEWVGAYVPPKSVSWLIFVGTLAMMLGMVLANATPIVM